MRWRGLICFGGLGIVFVSGCTQLPSPTHASKPSTNEYAGLGNFGKVTNHIWRGAQPTEAGYKNLIERGKVKSFLSLRRGANRDTADLEVAKLTGAQCFQVSMKEWDPGQDNLRRLALAVKNSKAIER